MRTYWELREMREDVAGIPFRVAGASPGQPGRLILVLGDDRFVGAVLHEASPGGPVSGFRMREDGQVSHLINATNLESAALGIREAFRSDQRDQSARLN